MARIKPVGADYGPRTKGLRGYRPLSGAPIFRANLEAVLTFVSYALWPLLTLAILALWFAATLEIVLHRSDEAFTSVKLLCMSALVSVAAAAAVVSVGAVFAGQWIETVERANPSQGVQADEQDSSRAYLFSFGLEHAFPRTPAESTNTEEQGALDGEHNLENATF